MLIAHKWTCSGAHIYYSLVFDAMQVNWPFIQWTDKHFGIMCGMLISLQIHSKSSCASSFGFYILEQPIFCDKTVCTLIYFEKKLTANQTTGFLSMSASKPCIGIRICHVWDVCLYIYITEYVGSLRDSLLWRAPRLSTTTNNSLTHLPLDKMAAISQTIFSDVFSRMKKIVFRFKFHWSVFPRAQLKISWHLFR